MYADYFNKGAGKRSVWGTSLHGCQIIVTEYDKETRKKTEEVEALRLHLGSMKLGNSVDIRLEATELPKIEPYSVVELENAVYDPYVMRGNYPTLVERVTCKGIRTVSGKSA